MEDNVIRKGQVEFRIRTITPNDFPKLMELFIQEGWTIGKNSLHTCYEMGPEGWKVAVNSSEEVVGVCFAVQLTDDFYQLKYYLVKEQYRGMGIGLKVWNACMEYVGHREACLRTSSTMKEIYENKSGFSFVDTDRVLRYATRGNIQSKNLSSELPEGVSIVSFEDSHLAAMVEYDPFYGKNNYRRQRVIELACKQKDSKTLVAFKNGACVGFGTIKVTLMDTLYLRPMYAEDVKIAEAMLKTLLQSFPGIEGFAMMTFAANRGTSDMMKKINCPKVDEFYHLYTKMNHHTMFKFKTSMQKIFALLEFDMLDF